MPVRSSGSQRTWRGERRDNLQIGNISLVFGVDSINPMTVGQEVGSVEITQKCRAINNADASIQPSHLRQTTLCN